MISIQKVNDKLNQLFPGYRIVQYNNEQLPLIEIIYKNFVPTFVCLIVRKKRAGIYIKLDMNGELMEIYPNINLEWKLDEFEDFEIPKIDFHLAGSIPYVSYNISTETIDDLYYITEYSTNGMNELHRIDIKTLEKNKRYIRIDDLSIFQKQFFGLTSLQKMAIFENKPDSVILYYFVDDQIPHAMNFNYNAFNERFQLVYSNFITK